MAQDFELNVEPRADLGKGASRRLRRLGDMVPAVIYGGGAEPVSITVSHKDIHRACENEAFFAHIVKINMKGGGVDNVIIKDLQRHPAKDRIMHADFLRVRMDQEITVEVPLHFLNEEASLGVKRDGGMVSHLMSSLEIACLPADLPEYIEIDVLELALGDSIHMDEVKLPSGVTIPALALGADHNQVVVSINASRATIETDNAEAEAPAADKPEE
ncbi:MAG: large subunit ribosomal protein L25 [Cyclobacteriaceae bacterium]|jgi:large subunit ribosomal protein L25